jgi:hypothetical protein
LARGHSRVGSLALHAVQPFEHPPATGQRVIDVDGLKEGLNRWLCLAQCYEAPTSLLVKTAKPWVKLLQRGDRLQGLRNLPKKALSDGSEQQGVALPGRGGENSIGAGKHFVEAALPQQFTQSRDIGAGWCGRISGWGGMHLR